MPIQRRLPKRGFTQTNRTEYNEVNVGGLARVEGGICDPTTLRRAGLVKGRGPVAVLGVGEVTQPLTVKAHRVTKSAQEKIIAAGGTVELLEVEAEFRRVKKGPAPKVSTRKRNQKSSGE